MTQLAELSNMPPAPFSSASGFKNATLRQMVHVAIGAELIRMQSTNILGGKAGSNAIDTATEAPPTFDGGQSSVTIPGGQVAYSDLIDYGHQCRLLVLMLTVLRPWLDNFPLRIFKHPQNAKQ
ncbi:lipolytic protein g-d-s-l family [Ophiostoma piceae UAMH 11346]|uniref:Lipolytic protein g-d-s-l family n=1 Tax=Ophiostoma piceae (strain UAMH 11346) TaxID=1262450 RepID=S3CEJ6_OPHP1|nr:lipolytic protein g-d-s-l family [Ophiostoma piceae UAMH 11346]